MRALASCETRLTRERLRAYGSRPVGVVDFTMRSGDRREGDRRAGTDRRHRRVPVSDDRRLAARRRGARRDGLAARLLRCVG